MSWAPHSWTATLATRACPCPSPFYFVTLHSCPQTTELPLLVGHTESRRLDEILVSFREGWICFRTFHYISHWIKVTPRPDSRLLFDGWRHGLQSPSHPPSGTIWWLEKGKQIPVGSVENSEREELFTIYKKFWPWRTWRLVVRTKIVDYLELVWKARNVFQLGNGSFPVGWTQKTFSIYIPAEISENF